MALRRILFLTTEYPPRIVGDVAVHVRLLAKRVVKEGILASVIAFDDWRPGETVENGIRVCRVATPVRSYHSILTWSPLSTPEFVRASSNIIRGEGADLIHSFEWLTGLAAITLKTVYDLPLVCTFHSLEAQRTPSQDSPLSKGISYLEREAAHAASVVTVANETTSRMLRTQYGIQKEKVHVIRLGEETDVKKLILIYRQSAGE